MRGKLKERLLGIGFVFAIMGIVFLVQGFGDLKRSKQIPFPIEDLDPDNIEKGMVVEGDIPFNYGAFMEEYTTNYGIKTGGSTYTYLIDLGDYGYIGVKTSNSSLDSQLSKQYDQTYDYVMYDNAALPQTVHVKGRIKKLDDESYGYMLEGLEYMGYSSHEASQYAYPYCINVEFYDKYSTFLGLGFVFFALGAGLLIFLLIALLKNKNSQGVPVQSFSNFNGDTSSSNPYDPNGTPFTPYEPNTTTTPFTPYEPSTTASAGDVPDSYYGSSSGSYSATGDSDSARDEETPDSDYTSSDGSGSKSSFSLKLDE